MDFAVGSSGDHIAIQSLIPSRAQLKEQQMYFSLLDLTLQGKENGSSVPINKLNDTIYERKCTKRFFFYLKTLLLYYCQTIQENTVILAPTRGNIRETNIFEPCHNHLLILRCCKRITLKELFVSD